MVRTQIQLDDKVAQRLPQLAKARGQSVAAFIREALDARIAELDRDREAAWDAMFSVLGKYADREGKTDVAERHDDYLAEDITERKVLRRRRS
jgi:predicted DNA-binding protein